MEQKVSACATCPGHCCTVFALGGNLSKEQAMQKAQMTGMSLLYRKDALKFARWAEPTSCKATEALDPRTQYYRCTKLVDSKCSVYNARPSFCKTFTCHNQPDRMWAAITDEEIKQKLKEIEDGSEIQVSGPREERLEEISRDTEGELVKDEVGREDIHISG